MYYYVWTFMNMDPISISITSLPVIMDQLSSS